MDKRRNETYNWYMLPMEERKKLMYNHGMIGRQYAVRSNNSSQGQLVLMTLNGA